MQNHVRSNVYHDFFFAYVCGFLGHTHKYGKKFDVGQHRRRKGVIYAATKELDELGVVVSYSGDTPWVIINFVSIYLIFAIFCVLR